jgi:hypothetical protein
LISGTTVRRKESAAATPAVPPGVHGWTLPSSHRFGTMYDRFGVVVVLVRSVLSWVKSTTSCRHALLSITEWKYTNGLRQVTYWSPGWGA